LEARALPRLSYTGLLGRGGGTAVQVAQQRMREGREGAAFDCMVHQQRWLCDKACGCTRPAHLPWSPRLPGGGCDCRMYLRSMRGTKGASIGHMRAAVQGGSQGARERVTRS